VYNDIERIFFTIDCVKKQTVDNVVHYIYDDASTDGLNDGIQEFLSDTSIRYTHNEQNSGQSYGRNLLIKQAIADGCDYIAFLDSDDFWHNDHLEKSISHLDQNDIVYSKPTFVGTEGVILQVVNIPVPDLFIGKHLLHNNYIWISSVVAKKECFVNNEFDSSLNGIEDWDMWIQLWKQSYKFVDKKEVPIRYLVKENRQASIGAQKYELLKQKYQILDKLRLHLACGYEYHDNFINVDLYAPEDAVCDVRFDVMKLPYPDNSVDEIKAFHIIEHFHFNETKQLFDEWYRVLKPGGRLWLETPDFLASCKSFVDGDPSTDIESWRIFLYGNFFATADPIPGQTHKFLFTENQLRVNLSWAKFSRVNRLSPTSKYVQPGIEKLFLNVEAFK
jgi:glycosyltransferase involved in cell wall biosynthesis